MSFETKLKFQDIAPSFDLILTEYDRVSKAPSLADFMERADKTGTSLQTLMRDESRKQYKALDTRSGDVYLCENPALMAYQTLIFERNNIKCGTVTRRKPKFLMSHKSATDLIKLLNKSGSLGMSKEIDYADTAFNAGIL